MQGVGGRLGESYPLVIGGKRVETEGEIASVNPANPSQVVGRVAAASEREADMALETATKAFESWSRTAPRRGRGYSCARRRSWRRQVRDARLGGLRGRQAVGRGRRAVRRSHRLPRVLRPRDAQAQRRRGDLRRPWRGEPLLLPAHGRRRHHRPVELPDGHTHRHVERGTGYGQRRSHEALRVHARHRCEGHGDLRRGWRAGGRRELPLRATARRSGTTWSRTRAPASSPSPAR